jgi:S-adenosylmethionine uptake transporter
VSAWPGIHAWWLLPIGALAAVGQWAMTRAYGNGSTLLVANLQYSGVVFAALLGLLWFGERLPWLSWLGMAVVVAAAVIATVLRAKNSAIPADIAPKHIKKELP